MTTLNEKVSEREPQESVVALQRILYQSKNPTRRWLHRSRRDWVISALRAVSGRLENRSAALEVGPGSGVYLPELCQQFPRVTATDIEVAHLSALKPMLGTYPHLSLCRDDITSPALDSSTFDLILCSEVIEHVPTTDGVLKGIHYLLKPGGYLIITTPQKYSLLELCARIALSPKVISIVRRIYAEPIEETGHINLLTARAFKGALVANDFEIISEYRLGMYVPIIAELFGLRGQAFLAWLQQCVSDTPLDFILWTQCYVVRKRFKSAVR
jgi:2-polyprenyl-3-methyl-5-hydroxy-6-metoxy-1,4-benzoquinol methylase